MKHTHKKQLSPLVLIGAWLLSFIVFIVGFWHTHLGLKEMRPFDSEYGSLSIASIILLLIIISYSVAVNGKKIALLFYIIGGLFFFIFNLNYFYPAYLARQLVKEEAIALNDTLQSFSNKINRMDNSNVSVVSELYNIKEKLLDEVIGQDGFGPRAQKYLDDFNALAKSDQLPNRTIGSTPAERKRIAERYDDLLTKDIRNYVLKQISNGKVENADELLVGIEQLKTLSNEYSSKLEAIIADNQRIPLDSVSNHPQINTLQSLVTKLDNATIKINKSSGKDVFPKLKEASTRNLGRIAHTLSSVGKRIYKIDTWGIILLCLFIDLLVPLFVYLMIKKEENSEHSEWLPFPKSKPSTY
jgi:hypothetical protein